MQKLDVNERIRLLIGDEPLRSALGSVHEAARAIWPAGSVYLIPNFPSHDLAHSSRVLEWLEFFARLADEAGHPLSDEELFVAAAGAYLHDVGMQCNPRLHWEVYKRASEDFGVEFRVPLDATGPLGSKELDEIRRTHHALSAAWLLELWDKMDCHAGRLLDSVPKHFREEVVQACLHHAKTDILDCPEYFEVAPTHRARLAAALLRLGDELDTDKARLNGDPITLVGLPAENVVYWWLLGRTHIRPDSKDEILITVALSRADADVYSPLVKRVVIDGFRAKNAAVIDVLLREGIRVFVSPESRVKSSRHFEDMDPTTVRELERLGGQDSSQAARLSTAEVDAAANQSDVDELRRELASLVDEVEPQVRRLMDAGDYAEAKRLAESLLAREPVRRTALIALAKAMAKGGFSLSDGALFGSTVHVAEYAATEALYWAFRGESKECERAAAKSLDAGKGATSSVLLGQAFDLLGHPRRALSLLESALDAGAPAQFERIRARLQLQLGYTRKALKTIKDFLDGHPDDPRGVQILGRCLHALRDYNGAVEQLELALDKSPELATAKALARALGGAGEHGKVIRLCSRFIKDAPRDYYLLFMRGAARFKIEDYSGAAKDLRRSIKAKPDYSPANYYLGRALAALGQHDDAIAAYERAIELDPEQRPALCAIASSELERSRPKAAVAAASRSLKMGGRCAECAVVLTYRGRARFELGHVRKAEADLRAAIADQPGNSAAKYYLASIYAFQLGRPEEAIQLAEDSLENDQLTIEQRDLMLVTEATAAFFAGEYDTACKAYSEVDGPLGDDDLGSLALALFYAGRFDESAGRFAELLKREPSADRWLCQACVFVALGDADGVFECIGAAHQCERSTVIEYVSVWYTALALGLIQEDRLAQEVCATLRNALAAEDAPVVNWTLRDAYEHAEGAGVSDTVLQELISVADQMMGCS